MATLLALILAFVLSLATALPAQAASRLGVTTEGLTLPGGTRFADGASVSVRYTVGSQTKSASLHLEALRGPGKQYVGASYLPWSALGTPSQFCITWVHVSGVGTFGESGDKPVCTAAPAPAPAPSTAPSPSAAPTAPPAAQKSAPQTAPTTQPAVSAYGVGLYVYKKLDAGKPASWGNSGPQRLVLQDVDNPSKAANGYWTVIDAAALPSDVCGSGWAVQQDKVQISGDFAFPPTITPPVDNIGWPPIYDAKHQELSSLVTVPACAGAEASVSVLPASCTAPERLVLGTAVHAVWGAVDRSAGPGDYHVTATAESGYSFAGGATSKSFVGTLAGALPSSNPACGTPASCIPTSSVSYSYDPATNSGVITVPSPANSTGKLCQSFWVTAASWKYLGTNTWAQKVDQVQKLGEISTPGSYPYGIGVVCGQGDIYASYNPNAKTLDPGPYLYGPSNPFTENFLHEMGFSGPTPTYTTTGVGCNTVSAEPSSTPPSCSAPGQYTLPEVEHVSWKVNGVDVEPGVYTVTAGGSVTVVATADESWVLPSGAQDAATHQWSFSWTLSFPAPENCRQATLTGGVAAVCENDVPMILYWVTLTDPDHQSTGNTATLSLSRGADSYSFPALGTIVDGQTLSGSLMWVGASAADVDGDGVAEGTGWPGWEFVDGAWQETPGNYGWTRDGVTATISVNPHVSVELQYPPGNPECVPGPREVTPTLSSVNPDCAANVGGSFTLPEIEGIVWKVDGVVTAPGSYPGGGTGTKLVTAELDQSGGAVVFAPNAQTSWRLDFTAPSSCLTLDGSTATGVCDADSPWILYTITLNDPYGQASDRTAELIMSDGVDNVERIALGTLGPSGVLSGKVLWPGAHVDPVTGAADGWPGWEQVDGEWVTTPGNFAWTRGITEATLSVNPSMTVALSYPDATPSCVTDPPHDPPTLGVFPTNAVLAEQCDAGRGVLTLGQVDGVSFFEDVNYFVDGVAATSSTVLLAPGSHDVTVRTKLPTDGLDGPSAWRVVVTGGQVCGELTTLALTGADGLWVAALAGLFLAAGVVIVVASRVRTRRAE
ncbi:hypothetical protein [Protaetiibacter larvae]|uniref:Uncharacterized protein n=1 Tax=Protaetiibacter larvae TaxID=2592654 RepID=A0A5C1Y5N2_9MICO|nr:hypothetical protein [Protaetiibacter larvae]QEO09091.1 hypothetical protein FLP23_03090 [Protaetiibacter larvae]